MNMNGLVPLCISHGYRLYHHNGHPFVVREWTRYRKNEKGDRVGERQEMRLELTSDHFDGTKQSREVFAELNQAWDEWVAWNKANAKEST